MLKQMVALGALFVMLPTLAWGDDRCDEGTPRKSQCFCQCKGMQANARAGGPCQIGERPSRWCAISYYGSTGSLGPDSIDSRLPDTSTSVEASSLDGLAMSLQIPDYRTDAYAQLVRQYSFDIVPPSSLLEIAAVAANADGIDDLPPDLAVTLFLWTRGGYLSLTPDVDESQDTLLALDEAVKQAIFSEPEVYRTFFGGADGRVLSTSDDLVVARGYLRFDFEGITVRVIYRDIMPNDG